MNRAFGQPLGHGRANRVGWSCLRPGEAAAWFCGCCLLAAKIAAAELVWEQLPRLPDAEGFAGTFAGVSHGTLLVAGGANFPERKPWEGGRKVWHDTVWALDGLEASWRIAGRLPRPLAYGVSATVGNSVVCAGGSDADRHYAECFRLTLTNGVLDQQPLPPLPVPLANAAGALLGDTLYVVGGADRPEGPAALNRFFALDLSVTLPRWRELESFPGRPRILPVAAVTDGAFFVIGGTALESQDGTVGRIYLRDLWRYRPGEGWQRLADAPQPCVAAVSPAPAEASRFYLVSGDDGALAGSVPAEKHPGFPPHVFEYRCDRDQWTLVGQTPAPRATLPGLWWQGRWILPSGEVRPGVRSPEVWTLRLSR
ncbi:MAG: galactose oxidase [Verrucomicrobia bacterium]|nr:galactose oxidase [Verrucomicrobiota bacterium]